MEHVPKSSFFIPIYTPLPHPRHEASCTINRCVKDVILQFDLLSPDFESINLGYNSMFKYACTQTSSSNNQTFFIWISNRFFYLQSWTRFYLKLSNFSTHNAQPRLRVIYESNMKKKVKYNLFSNLLKNSDFSSILNIHFLNCISKYDFFVAVTWNFRMISKIGHENYTCEILKRNAKIKSLKYIDCK